MSREISAGDPHTAQQMYQRGIAAIQPGWDYFNQTILGTMFPQVEIFKAARLFNPHKVCQLRPIANDIDVVASIEFLNDPKLIRNLNTELPRYLTKADEIGVHWWKTNEAELLHWSSAAKMVLLLQPSSAASERVFSILTT